MKIKDGFVVEKVGSKYLAVAVGARADECNALIRMNETGAFLWNKLAEGEKTIEELAALTTAEYDVDIERARVGAEKFVESLRGAKLLDE